LSIVLPQQHVGPEDPSIPHDLRDLVAFVLPKLRYTAGSMAGRVSVLRRIVPSRAFDKQIRKLNRLAG
jgi:hypothetical protein